MHTYIYIYVFLRIHRTTPTGNNLDVRGVSAYDDDGREVELWTDEPDSQ